MDAFIIFGLGILWVGIGSVCVLGALSLWCKAYKRFVHGK